MRKERVGHKERRRKDNTLYRGTHPRSVPKSMATLDLI